MAAIRSDRHPDVAANWNGGVLASFYRVAFARPDAEIAGLLVGRPAAAGGIAQIDAVIPLHEAGMFGASAPFTHEAWAYAHQVMARHYPGLEILGWYVSRPGTGTGLRAPEVAAHARWFSRPYQMALVLDSTAYRGALYAWRGGELVEIHEGPIERRYTRPPTPRTPWGAYALLAGAGSALGAAAYLLTYHVP